MYDLPRAAARCAAVGLFVLMLAGVSSADWKLGDPHKMHYPQLPDPTGWDVDVTSRWIADDWQCSQTGPVSDLHFWVSFRSDYFGIDPFTAIDQVWVRFYTDVPKDAPDNNFGYSYPSEQLLREYRLPAGSFTMIPAGQGPQGWFTPDFEQPIFNPGTASGAPDHFSYFQINIDQLVDPFVQRQGQIYWAAIHIIPANQPTGEIPMIGWKTSIDHFNDDAVYDIAEPGLPPWMELYDPLIVEPVRLSLDMAFVITPEPATLGLLSVGLLLALRRR